MNAATLINQDSGNVEIYTPANILEAARRTLGGFDLDPASSALANRTVNASRIFSAGGLSETWTGRVWMNHPFGKRLSRPALPKEATEEQRAKYAKQLAAWRERCRFSLLDPETAQTAPGNEDWINKLVSEFDAGRVSAACCICFASTSERWFKPLLFRPQCFLSPRTNYLLPDGSVYHGVTKGSAVTYFGPDVAAFAREFSALGVVKVPFL